MPQTGFSAFHRNYRLKLSYQVSSFIISLILVQPCLSVVFRYEPLTFLHHLQNKAFRKANLLLVSSKGRLPIRIYIGIGIDTLLKVKQLDHIILNNLKTSYYALLPSFYVYIIRILVII
jgi:hypothetical protein